jgi:hypothetical protein
MGGGLFSGYRGKRMRPTSAHYIWGASRLQATTGSVSRRPRPYRGAAFFRCNAMAWRARATPTPRHALPYGKCRLKPRIHATSTVFWRG